MRWVVHGQNFVNAYHAVMRNQGAAGVDGMPTEALPKHLTHHWERIKAELLRGEYCPQPVRGVKIPKPSGGTRQLGIPVVMDRQEELAAAQSENQNHHAQNQPDTAR